MNKQANKEVEAPPFVVNDAWSTQENDYWIGKGSRVNKLVIGGLRSCLQTGGRWLSLMGCVAAMMFMASLFWHHSADDESGRSGQQAAGHGLSVETSETKASPNPGTGKNRNDLSESTVERQSERNLVDEKRTSETVDESVPQINKSSDGEHSTGSPNDGDELLDLFGSEPASGFGKGVETSQPAHGLPNSDAPVMSPNDGNVESSPPVIVDTLVPGSKTDLDLAKLSDEVSSALSDQSTNQGDDEQGGDDAAEIEQNNTEVDGTLAKENKKTNPGPDANDDRSAASTTTSELNGPEFEEVCHSAYLSCIPLLDGDALNCVDLLEYDAPIRLKDIGIDPYKLDGRDQDGLGCELNRILPF